MSRLVLGQHTPSSSLPPALKVKLYELFGQIEKEFEVLYNENMGLQERVDNLTASSNASMSIHSQTNQPSSQPNNMTGKSSFVQLHPIVRKGTPIKDITFDLHQKMMNIETSLSCFFPP